VWITAGSREVPGRNACDRRHTYRIIIIIIINVNVIKCKKRKKEKEACYKLKQYAKQRS